MRFVDALVSEGKRFDLLVIPNAAMAWRAYGERRMRISLCAISSGRTPVRNR